MKITKNQSLVLAVSIIALFFAIGIWFMPRSAKLPSATVAKKEATPQPTTAPVDGTPSQESKFMLKEFQRAEIKDGRKVWEAKGAQGQYFPETNSAKITAAQLWMYKKDGKVIVMNAGEALLRLQGAGLKSADATNGVVVTYDDKETLKTDNLTYDKEKETLYAPGHVEITGDFIDISGDVLEGDLSDNSFVLKQNVSTILKPKGMKNAPNAQ
ncbi:MAG: LPS export ABC transporter periplasmic protein LptC [Deltaproteobacteria bacterium]|nr:LPS export ABC transporter periplasmic protein LptC [Deltaproteobacteria bacterium]